MVRLSILFLQELFKAAPRGYYHWDENDEETEIIFTKETPVDQDVVHKRPVVAIVRSNVGWQGIGMDQLRYQNTQTGEREHVDMLSGHLTFNCLTREGDESEQIAWLVASHTWILRRVLLKLGFHDIGQRFQIGAQQPPGQLVQGSSKSEIINVPATSSFQFHVGARVLEQDVPVLGEIEANVTAAMASAYRATNARAGLSGTGLVQADGNPVEYQNIKGRIRPPSIRGRPATITQVVGSNRPSEPTSVTVKVEADEG
jgi:hypothetical protein